ncbi:MAG: polysaccharide deacetylase family protein [Sneathiella sp.]
MLLIMWIGFALCSAFTIWILLPYIYKVMKVRELRKLCKAYRTIVLTYDDGPSGTLTPKVLKLLSGFDANATFFLLGKRVERNPEIIPSIITAGNEIGNHSHSHLNAWKQLPWKVAADISMGERTIQDRGASPSLFRPPNGKITLATLFQTIISKKELAMWTIDSGDTRSKTMTYEQLLNRIREDGGGVILLHDFEREHSSSRNDFVLGATQRLLELAQKEHFQIATFGELKEKQILIDNAP